MGEAESLIRVWQETKLFRVIYIFSGPRRAEDVADWIQQLCSAAGCTDVAVDHYDILLDLVAHNLLDSKVQMSVLSKIQTGEYHAGLASPLCSSWSRLLFAPHGPPPIHNLSHPWGFPWLKNTLAQKAHDGNELVKFTIQFCHTLHQQLAVFLIEHPEDLGATSNGDLPASI